MDEKRLSEVEARANAATLGPWVVNKDPDVIECLSVTP